MPKQVKTFRLDEELYNKFKQLANSKYRSTANLMEIVMQQELDKNDNDNKQVHSQIITQDKR